jgi:6-phosphogluconolactonase
MTDRLLPAGLALALTVASAAAADPVTVYVGTYTDGTSRGIYRFSLDLATGTASAPVLAGEASNPSFLALHPNGRFLYAVDEISDFGGAKTGAVSAFAIDAKTGDLTRLNQQPSRGAGPCHLVVDRSGGNVLVANYGGGTVAVLRIAPDGRLQPASSVRTHAGTGPNAARQDKPHAHGIYLDARERFALSPDLGADRVFVYRFDAGTGVLEPHGAAPLEPGSGPRHLAFDPSGRHVYVISELSSTVTAFTYDPDQGTLAPLQIVSALPAGFSGASYTAEIAVSPDGRFLYGSNRGDDSLAVFRVDAATGRLAPAGRVPVGGSWPRHFAIDAAGRVLVAAHQRSASISIFRLDPTTGLPGPIGALVAVDRPACVLLAPAPR